jgi:hypothetical protein
MPATCHPAVQESLTDILGNVIASVGGHHPKRDISTAMNSQHVSGKMVLQERTSIELYCVPPCFALFGGHRGTHWGTPKMAALNRLSAISVRTKGPGKYEDGGMLREVEIAVTMPKMTPWAHSGGI